MLAQAVHAVHEAGILHRDLKPSNVLMTSRGEPKITDFGLAKLLSNDSLLTTAHCLLGTPSYMPPEQAGGDSRATFREGDIYSLGAILYELLTGRPPFLGVTILCTLSMIRERDPIPPRNLEPRIPRDLETICLKCLSKSPTARYRSGAELADDLGRFLAGTTILARRPAVFERVALGPTEPPGGVTCRVSVPHGRRRIYRSRVAMAAGRAGGRARASHAAMPISGPSMRPRGSSGSGWPTAI